MDIKLDDKPEKPPREGDDRLGIPQSRVEGAWIRTDMKGEDHPRQRDGKSRYESEKELKGAVKSTIAAPDNGPGKSLREGDDGLGIPQSHIEGARALTDKEIEKHKHQQEEELRRKFEEEDRRAWSRWYVVQHTGGCSARCYLDWLGCGIGIGALPCCSGSGVS